MPTIATDYASDQWRPLVEYIACGKWNQSSLSEWMRILGRSSSTVSHHVKVIRDRLDAGSLSAGKGAPIAVNAVDAVPAVVVPDWARDTPSFEVPESPVALADGWLRLEGDFGLISDIHIPYYDKRVIERFMTECYRLGIKRFIAIGDSLDGNQFHPKRGGLQHERRYQDDVEVAKTLWRAFLQVFEKGYVLHGNHDGWFGMHFRGQIDPEWMLSHIYHEFGDRLTWSEYEQADVTSGGHTFKLLHGANYSGANPLGVAQRLSAKFECGIVMGHQHHHVAGFSHSGKHQCVCLGGAHDERRFSYVHRSPRTNPAQTRGFAILKDGFVKDYPMMF